MITPPDSMSLLRLGPLTGGQQNPSIRGDVAHKLERWCDTLVPAEREEVADWL